MVEVYLESSVAWREPCQFIQRASSNVNLAARANKKGEQIWSNEEFIHIKLVF